MNLIHDVQINSFQTSLTHSYRLVDRGYSSYGSESQWSTSQLVSPFLATVLFGHCSWGDQKPMTLKYSNFAWKLEPSPLANVKYEESHILMTWIRLDLSQSSGSFMLAYRWPVYTVTYYQLFLWSTAVRRYFGSIFLSEGKCKEVGCPASVASAQFEKRSFVQYWS